MEDLYKRLTRVPDFYFDFGIGVMSYARKNPMRKKIVMEFLDSSEELTTTEILEFIVAQPDFHDDEAASKRKVG